MSILIKGMEMPKNCIECRFENFNNCDVLDKRVESVDVPPWCPLIPVPPHGDLIDRDALMHDADNFIHKTMLFGGQYVYSEKAIKKAPTIIEAEGE